MADFALKQVRLARRAEELEAENERLRGLLGHWITWSDGSNGIYPTYLYCLTKQALRLQSITPQWRAVRNARVEDEHRAASDEDGAE